MRGYRQVKARPAVNAKYLINEAFYQKQKIPHQAVHKSNLNMGRIVCVIKTVAYRARTQGQTKSKNCVKTTYYF